MSALRAGINPDGSRHIIVLEPAVGRISYTRYGIRGGNETIIPRYTSGVSADSLDRVRKNPDNGAVEASITEVQT